MIARPDALLLYSGGIDSVQALHARCDAGQATHVHHVRMSNWEGRAANELAAVRSTLAWLNQHYPNLITYTESGFDYGDLRYIVRDHNVWSLFAGIILANPKNAHLSKVIRTFHRDSVVGGLGSAAGRAAESGWRLPVERLAKHDIELVYPQIGMTKAEIMAALPGDLLRLCWYCRRPRGSSTCHDCHTCKQVGAALASEDWTPLDERGAQARAVAPRGNAAREAWATHARSLGITTTDEMTRADIREAVRNGDTR